MQRIVDLTLCHTTVLPAKRDSEVKFCLKIYQGVIVDRSLVQDRIITQVIYRFALAQVMCTS